MQLGTHPDSDQPQPPLEDEEWPTNGGPLGCLIASAIGFILAAFIASPLIRSSSRAGLASLVYSLSGYGIMLACVIIFGFIGWRLGKKFFIEYPKPK